MVETQGPGEPGDVTLLLARWVDGDSEAEGQLFTSVYAELRRLAGSLLRGERPGRTLQPTALVHEAFLKLVASRAAGFEDRRHFFGIAARAMRQLLVDHARSYGRQKRLPRGSGRRGGARGPRLSPAASRALRGGRGDGARVVVEGGRLVRLTCAFYGAAECGGGPIGSPLVTGTILGDTGATWVPLADLFTAPAGAVSALCSIDLITASGQSFEAALDRARLVAPGELFTDGFESGDVSAWTSSVPGSPSP